jgi:hypothetical protein
MDPAGRKLFEPRLGARYSLEQRRVNLARQIGYPPR